MKLTFTKYKAYKDFGIDWLGTIPAEWAVARNKEIFKERSSLSATGKETLLTVSHITGVTPRSEKNVNMFMAETMEGYKICRPGDLIINTMWAWMGALGTSNELGICSPSYNVYMPIKGIPYNHRYFDYLFRIPNAIVEMTRNSKGIVSSRLRLYAKDFFQIETVLPPLKEQKTIAHYLDTKTAQIDRKIDLLTQKATQYGNLKQSLINETVTRGLDKSVAMKDSATEWLGELPEHWEVKRLKDISPKITTGGTPTEELFVESGFKWYTPGDFDGDLFLTKSRKEVLGKPNVKIYPKNSILIVSIGATLGKIGISRDSFSANQQINIIYASRLYLSPYIAYFLSASIDTIKASANASTIGIMNQSKTGQILVCVPSLSEQKEIADYLDTKTAQIDQIIQTINTQIEKLKELRKTLINDVITGKIKVTQDL